MLSSTEQKYSTYEKEAFAIMYCINHFRFYLYNRKFTIVCNHKPLIWIKTSKDLTFRLARWRLKIEEYEYDIVYKSGKINVNANALSRNPIMHIEIIKAIREYKKLFSLPILSIYRSGRNRTLNPKGQQYRELVQKKLTK